MSKENELSETIVAFTFNGNDNLRKAFVDTMKEWYGKDNVCNIDQSTYEIKNQTLTLDDVLAVLHKAEECGECHKETDQLCVFQVIKSNVLVLNTSLDFEQRLKNIK